MKEIFEMMKHFEGSFINDNNELILDRNANIFISIKDCETKSDLIVKFLHWVSRDCCKNPNSRLRIKLQKGFNSWVGIPFKTSDFYDFYDNFGNGINHDFAVGTANSMV